MNYKSLIRHQVAVRVGTVSEVVISTHNKHPEALISTTQGRIFVVLAAGNKGLKAQMDVIAQLNQIMNNTSIKRV